MSNKKISALPTKTTPASTDMVPIVDTANPNNLATKRTTFANVLSAFNVLQTSNVGVPNGVAGLDAAGKIPTEQIPAIAINDTFVVNSASELVALSAEVGDVAVRTDLNKSFILATAPAATLNNWVELLASGIPANNSLDGGNF
jgi:hypothetical protein